MTELDHQLLSVQEYKAVRFPGKRPCVRTLRNWIVAGKLPGQKIGNVWFVKIPRENTQPHDPLLEKMLDGV